MCLLRPFSSPQRHLSGSSRCYLYNFPLRYAFTRRNDCITVLNIHYLGVGPFIKSDADRISGCRRSATSFCKRLAPEAENLKLMLIPISYAGTIRRSATGFAQGSCHPGSARTSKSQQRASERTRTGSGKTFDARTNFEKAVSWPSTVCTVQ